MVKQERCPYLVRTPIAIFEFEYAVKIYKSSFERGLKLVSMPSWARPVQRIRPSCCPGEEILPLIGLRYPVKRQEAPEGDHPEKEDKEEMEVMEQD
ncbi:hypothetical protein TNIN_87591 [Trichonephila inaurata madagascariensis]|uniref:Uncharacterized protein n=1 Tax=Trichonephila inaurata madagascariensis TaxID=2747483 RepID=A0A8X6YJH8_9ARAC|nr:hypothetical protein TNIN_87591 [Trichonephila inaurata madagascariensis]